jgi:hypothetical protein
MQKTEIRGSPGRAVFNSNAGESMSEKLVHVSSSISWGGGKVQDRDKGVVGYRGVVCYSGRGGNDFSSSRFPFPHLVRLEFVSDFGFRISSPISAAKTMLDTTTCRSIHELSSLI